MSFMLLSEAIYLANLLASAPESAEWMAQRAEPVMAGRPQPAAQKLNVNMVSLYLGNIDLFNYLSQFVKVRVVSVVRG